MRRSRPPSPLCQTIPRPPSTSPSKASPLSKRLNRSFVPRVQGQHTGASGSPSPEITKTPVFNKITSSGHISSRSSSSFSSRATDKTKVETPKQCRSFAETSKSPSRSSTFQTNTAGGAAAHVTHRSSNYRSRKKCDLFPQEREDGNSRLACRSRSISGLGPQCSTGSHSSNRNDRSTSATSKSKTQNSTTVPVGTV